MSNYIQTMNSKIVRLLTISLVDNESGNDRNNKRIRTELTSRIDKLNQTIKARLNEIAQVCDLTPFPTVVAKTSPLYPTINEIVEVFSTVSTPKDLRILINFIKYEDPDAILNTINSNKITHLIEFSLVNDAAMHDLNVSGTSCATIHIENANPFSWDWADKLMKIIEDIMLDISMFHTLIDEYKPNRNIWGKNLSSLKIEYVKERGLKSEYWNIEKNVGYITLASYFRRNKGFDCEGYVDACNSVVKKFHGLQYNKEHTQLINQLRRHKNWGQLSIKKINKIYQTLPSGCYILVRLIKIPLKKRLQASLLCLFGGTVLKVGKIKIVPQANINVFYKYERYGFVNLFKIYK